MKKILLASLSGCLATAGLALAQPPAIVNMPLQPGPMLVQAEPAKEAPKGAPAAAAPTTAPTIIHSDCANDCCPKQTRFWASAEYLLWWLKRDDNGQPLITTGDPALAVLAPGALGEPGTAILANQSSFDQGVSQGLRLEAGFMLNDRFGVALSGFFLEKQTNYLSFASDPAGNTTLAVPFFDLNTIGPAPFAHQISGDGIVAGDASLSYSTELWGLETNAVIALGSAESRNLKLLVGLRYADLIDNFTYQDRSGITAAGDAQGFALFFNGVADVPAGNSVGALDNFRTRNQFYGGQVGLQGEWERGRFILGATGKLALGVTHQALEVQGVSFQTVNATGAVVASAPGGILAVPSNIGIQSDNHFTVVPELTVKVGYRITDALTATVAYNFMYWSSVVRPFDNVPTSSNTFFIPTDASFGVGGGAGPAPIFERSSFWAQGVNFGLEFKY
jgi:hypothetical protein